MHHGHKNKQKLTKTVFSVYLRDLNSGAPIRFVQFVPRFVPRCPLYSFIISMVHPLLSIPLYTAALHEANKANHMLSLQTGCKYRNELQNFAETSQRICRELRKGISQSSKIVRLIIRVQKRQVDWSSGHPSRRTNRLFARRARLDPLNRPDNPSACSRVYTQKIIARA